MNIKDYMIEHDQNEPMTEDMWIVYYEQLIEEAERTHDDHSGE